MTHLIKIIFSVLLLQSCSTTLDNNNKNSKTVKQLYEQNNYKKDIKYKSLGVNSGFVRTQQNELENRFLKLHNPTLNMFIFPHLIDNSHPIPGYTTNFKMYKADQYALPQEIY